MNPAPVSQMSAGSGPALGPSMRASSPLVSSAPPTVTQRLLRANRSRIRQRSDQKGSHPVPFFAERDGAGMLESLSAREVRLDEPERDEIRRADKLLKLKQLPLPGSFCGPGCFTLRRSWEAVSRRVVVLLGRVRYLPDHFGPSVLFFNTPIRVPKTTHQYYRKESCKTQ